MQYDNGSPVALGDIVNVPIAADRWMQARVVMLGETYEHLDLDASHLDWIKKERLLEPSSVVVEWIGPNPFAHDDPQYAPVGNHMFTDIAGVTCDAKAAAVNQDVYVQLLDEGVDVWRPVAAEHVRANMYRIIGQPPNETEHWEFGPGDVVLCRMQALSEGPVLVAYEKAPPYP